MINITESTINSLIEKYENEIQYLADLKEIGETQNDLMSFIDQENYTLLTKEEITLLEYLTTVIYFSCKALIGNAPKISGKELEKSEEDNWDIFNASTSKNFTKIIDIYFENYKQEDLLALVEDSIQQDEESVVTTVGREIIFVACKSIIDTIDTLN